MKSTERVRLIAFLSSIAGAASAQTAPAAPAPPAVAPAPAPAAPAPAAPAPAPAPAAAAAAPTEAAPVATPAAPAPAQPPSAVAPLVLSSAPPAAPAPASGSGRSDQGRFLIGAAWNVAVPVGSVRTFTDQVSALGFEFLIRYFALPQLSLGVSTDFQTFAETRPRTTYPIDNGALTATAYNSVRNSALRATAHYYFLKDAKVLPYAGANIGVGWSTFQTAAADLIIYDNQSSILLGAEVGALFPVAKSLAFMTAFRYSSLPAMDFLQISNSQNLTFQFGVLTL